MNSKYNLETIYFPDNDVYSIRLKGKGIQNFNSTNFFSLPRRARESQILALIRVGLNHNIGEEKTKNQIILQRNWGKRIR
jgi:hypothetical protein